MDQEVVKNLFWLYIHIWNLHDGLITLEYKTHAKIPTFTQTAFFLKATTITDEA